MTYFIDKQLKLDFSDEQKTREESQKLAALFFEKKSMEGEINIQEFKPDLKLSEFLAPVFINWTKPVDAANLLDSKTISDKRKKIIRQALGQSERLGVKCEIINPLDLGHFREFLDYYNKNHQEHNYESYLGEDYLIKHDPQRTYLIKVTAANGEYLGGRLIHHYAFKLSTDQRATERTKQVKEGYDTICEKMFFELGAQLGEKHLARGKEFNLRGIAGRKIGLLWNKLKFGYHTRVLPHTPRVYADYGFLKEVDFDLAFFVSLENVTNININNQKFVWNFVLGNNPNWEEIESIREKLKFPIHIYNREFKLEKEFLPN